MTEYDDNLDAEIASLFVPSAEGASTFPGYGEEAVEIHSYFEKRLSNLTARPKMRRRTTQSLADGDEDSEALGR